MRELEELQRSMGYRFREEELLRRALTHSSYANETGTRNHHLLCNERLEFLGDAILSAVSSTYLYDRYSERPEGDLTRMRSAIVCESALDAYAEKLHLGDYLLLGKGELNNGGAGKKAIRADAFEAVLAAIYLDTNGSLETVKEFLIPFLQEAVESVQLFDAKSLLQELVEKDAPGNRLDYRVVGEDGPDHAKTYQIEVYLDSNCIGKGIGNSKRHAEQAAAEEALSLFGVRSSPIGQSVKK